MNINHYLKQFPRSQRNQERERLAKEIGVSIFTVIAWGRSGKAARVPHHKHWRKIDASTRQQVSIHDLLHDTLHQKIAR